MKHFLVLQENQMIHLHTYGFNRDKLSISTRRWPSKTVSAACTFGSIVLLRKSNASTLGALTHVVSAEINGLSQLTSAWLKA